MAGDKDTFCRRIYYAARDGMAITVSALLAELNEHIINGNVAGYLNYINEEDGQKCTPLITACMNGHNKVVKVLLNTSMCNIEQEGTVQLDGYVIEGATPLWCAAGAGHCNVVKTLVSYGANVNHPTKTNSTPLRAACFDGWLDIVQYLVEHGADIHISNEYNNTCLMISSYRGHRAIVKYLLSQNVDINAQANCGATALHFAAERDHILIVQDLLKANAKIMKNNIGMTPLLTAAEQTNATVVDYLVGLGDTWFSREEHIEAVELLGASYANDKEQYDSEKAYCYLDWAMRARNIDPKCCKPKVLLPPIVAYDYHIECQTLEELQAIRYNSNALHMESLVVRERILGSNNPEVSHPIIFRGAVFADEGQFDKCINLWLHALHLRHNSQLSIRKDLLRFAQLFAQMLHIGEDVSFTSIHQVLCVAINELQKNISNIRECDNGTETRCIVIEEFEDNIHTILYLLVISTKVIKKFSSSEVCSIYQCVYQINKLLLRTSDGSTLLHLAVNAETPVDDFHTKNVCKFPCAATAHMLIECGANVNAINNAGNTPLHIIVAYQKPITDFMTLHHIIIQLIEAGAHIDCVNNNGETPSDAALTGVAEIILKAWHRITLQCLAAKTIRKFNIVYKNRVPQTLISFIEMHGKPQKTKS